jgi:Subtilase family
MFGEDITQVDVVDQIIVGFNRKLTAVGVDTAMDRLSKLPAKVLAKFVAAPPDTNAFFAIAVIRYDGDKTFAALQEQLKADEHVEWVERNAPVTLAAPYNDELLDQQWALETLGATEPWTVTPPAGKTIVAIVDSGLRRFGGTVHADLGLVEPGGGVDMEGHGTFLAGTIAARPGNGAGIASPIHPSWNISLLSQPFFGPGVPPTAVGAAVAVVLAASYNLGEPKVINASWHVPGDGGLMALRAAILFATAPLIDSLVVFAAGNDGTDNEEYPLFPANFCCEPAFAGKVLTVLATDRYDAKAFFSNFGPNTVQLGAPGLRILTTARYLVNPPRYASYSGTSAAAAYASAGAALMFALNRPNWDKLGAPCWKPVDAIRHLLASADTVQNLDLACIGGKRLNLKRAVYGPLHITAPAGGATLSRSATNFITWTNDYSNPALSAVRIEFSTNNFATPPTTLAPTWSISAGAFPCPPGMLALTAAGRIRITPTKGNFPVVAGPFTVVA